MADSLDELIQAIADRDDGAVRLLLERRPELARASAEIGATRGQPKPFFLRAILRYVYAGDTALHVAAAAYRLDLVEQLLSLGADPRAKNRRGVEPLHAAAESFPGSRRWDPEAQAATIAGLIGAGADPNAETMEGATPLHRAVRTRGAAAVRALLEGGADPGRCNRAGSTPLKLAGLTTGRGGAGSPEARREQAEIIELLRRAGAGP
jgi:ankyrin repeat protein